MAPKTAPHATTATPHDKYQPQLAGPSTNSPVTHGRSIMPSRKRPYVPKVKGCHPCTRRRIHCDRTGPECRKCVSRGLKCVGLGVEIWLPSTDSSQQGAGNVHHGEGATYAVQDGSSHAVDHGPSDRHAELGQTSFGDDIDDAVVTLDQPISNVFLGTETPSQSLDSLATSIQLHPIVTEHVPAWKRQLVSHFSTHIAFEMVAIDDNYNSWRHLVLPFACQDELVMSAVLAVSAFHNHLVHQSGSPLLNVQGDTLQSLPPELHALDRAVLAGLKKRWELTNCDIQARQSVLITILVLHVGAMVTGRSDFPFIYRMLESAFEAMGGESGLGNGEAVDFILSQVVKFRFYGATMLDEKQGLDAISSQAGHLINALSSRWSGHPEHNQTMAFVNSLVLQAINLYIEQACVDTETGALSNLPGAGLQTTKTVMRVQHFIETLDALLQSPMGASCEQVLIWATFVVASGCVLQEHIDFFEHVFLRHYARCGFLNVLVGLNRLRKMWLRNSCERRTRLIAQTQILVM